MYATSQEERNWGMLCHLTSLCGILGIPGFIGPLIVWLIYKDRYPFVDDQGRESLNFQLSLMIYYLVLFVAATIFGFITCGFGWFLFLPPILIIAVAQLIIVILASVSANAGTPYRYPFSIRFL